MTLKIYKKWIPEEDELYYVPFFGCAELYKTEKNYNTVYDDRLIRWGLAFKTSNEAIEAANKMLEAIKEDK
jgi:hypothetical protein